MVQILVFDFDSTLIKDESLVSLLTYTLQKTEQISGEEVEKLAQEIQKITLQGISGEISMIESYRKRLSIARPTKDSVNQYLNDANDLPTPGMANVIQTIRNKFPSVHIHVISQGPSAVVTPICQAAFNIPSHHVHAVELTLGEQGEQVDYITDDEPMLKRGKSSTLDGILSSYKDEQSNPDQIVVVGDGVSDMKMKTEGPATVAIGFGVHLQFELTKKLSDYYVTNIEQLTPILCDIFSNRREHLDVHVRENQVFNFFAGPATMPTSLLQQVSDEMLSYQHSLGYSVVEMSHRSKDFEAIMEHSMSTLRELLEIPNTYEILYMQGGATLQFSAVPLNLCRFDKNETCDYFTTGLWSKKAGEEAKRCFSANEDGPQQVKVHHLNQQSLTQNDSATKVHIDPNTQFVYYCDNETVNGIELKQPPIDMIHPSTKRIPFVCDMSSNLLTRRINITDFDLIYACAQKNFGIAGLTVVIVKKTLLGKAPKWIPSLLDYKVIADGHSLQNTPTTFSIYVADLMFDWIKNQGGVDAMDELCKAKSNKLYDFIDNSNYYSNNIPKHIRSRLNVVFRIKQGDEKLETLFVKLAKERGLIGLDGHRSVGGLRASMYNALSMTAS
ncbi:phosphoserine aminotransferase [Acrasis kona]|uniref:phosphoserine transaminase n=1 Tax=Acrasis kona TaxID=1008807 RepID=A0AAW2YXL7_9EUKA